MPHHLGTFSLHFILTQMANARASNQGKRRATSHMLTRTSVRSMGVSLFFLPYNMKRKEPRVPLIMGIQYQPSVTHTWTRRASAQRSLRKADLHPAQYLGQHAQR